mgnify:CR=1 FL=1
MPIHSAPSFTHSASKPARGARRGGVCVHDAELIAHWLFVCLFVRCLTQPCLLAMRTRTRVCPSVPPPAPPSTGIHRAVRLHTCVCLCVRA